VESNKIFEIYIPASAYPDDKALIQFLGIFVVIDDREYLY